jgi:hypothetical protein
MRGVRREKGVSSSGIKNGDDEALVNYLSSRN